MKSNEVSLLLSFFFILFTSLDVHADSFKYNYYNNHGAVGLINIPTARFFEEESHGITAYNGSPDQKITMTSSPYNWLEASFFYMNLKNVELCRSNGLGERFCQGYKDKGFNLKLKLKEEGIFPAIAIGINDLAGTGFYSSEYVVASYGIKNLDLHLGLGWGNLNGSKNDLKNPFTFLSDRFENRPDEIGEGGQFQPSRYFSGKSASPFFGISYILRDNLTLKFETDPTLIPGKVGYEDSNIRFSFGANYEINKNFSIGVFQERNNYFSVRFSYKKQKEINRSSHKYKTAKTSSKDDRFTKLVKNLEENGIGVNKIIETADFIGLELTQFSHPNLDVIEEIITSAKIDSGIKKDTKTDLRIADLSVSSDFEESLADGSNIIYERKKRSNFNTKNRISFRPFIASREEFFKGAIMFENDSELTVRDNLFLSSNVKYSIADNFDDLTLPPADTYPAQVRSDVKDYLRNFDDGPIIGRAQLDYYISPKRNHHFQFTGGILEEMFNGYGMEYLYFEDSSNYAFGFEVFKVKKRDYELRLGTLDYENITAHANFYYRNYSYIPFDAKVSFGEYLAGDLGGTFEISRSFKSGLEFGIFATFTDVTSEQFGEGSFDKGIFFNIPIFSNMVSYTWRPLTKDPGAKLIRKNNLYDLLVKFRPIN